MLALLKDKGTFKALGIVALRIVKLSGRSFREITVWFSDGRKITDIIA